MIWINLYGVAMIVIGLWAVYTFAGHALDAVMTPIVLMDILGDW